MTVCDGFAAKFDGFVAYATALCFSKFAVIMRMTDRRMIADDSG
jgi:hypothetical protein